jgi:hypothetical protein
MMRSLYRFLLWLHPLEFRQEFAGEMLWIFDEAAGSVGVVPLLADVLASLGRQRLVRSGAWTYAVGVMVHAALLSALFLGTEPPKPRQPVMEPAPPAVHYTLYYVAVKSPPWNDSKLAVLPRP